MEKEGLLGLVADVLKDLPKYGHRDLQDVLVHRHEPIDAILVGKVGGVGRQRVACVRLPDGVDPVDGWARRLLPLHGVAQVENDADAQLAERGLSLLRDAGQGCGAVGETGADEGAAEVADVGDAGHDDEGRL